MKDRSTNGRTAVVVALIGAIATIMVAYFQFRPKPAPDDEVMLAGRVVDAITQHPIAGAKVSLDLAAAPTSIYTDDEGVYRFPLKARERLGVTIHIDAAHYRPYMRRIESNGGFEEIRLDSAREAAPRLPRVRIDSVREAGGQRRTVRQPCPDVGGSWERVVGHLVMKVVQSRCEIRGTITTRDYNHALTGRYREGHYEVEISRSNVRNGCQSTLYGNISMTGVSRFVLSVYASDGRCALPEDYHEAFEWVRP